jgi:signal peptidase II
MSQYFSIQKNAWPWLSVTVVVLFLDQTAKLLVSHCLILGQSVRLLPFFNLTLVYNRGVAFGFLNIPSVWAGSLFTCIASISVALLVLWLWQLSRTAYLKAFSISLIAGGRQVI